MTMRKHDKIFGMRNLLNKASGTAIAIAAAALLNSGSAHAQDNSAVVFMNDFGCTVLDGDENADVRAWAIACQALFASSRFQILE